jgi:hypothetical protein
VHYVDSRIIQLVIEYCPQNEVGVKVKKIAGYAVACAIGAMLSGTTVFAATTYVKAQKGTCTIALNGQAVSHPPIIYKIHCNTL